MHNPLTPKEFDRVLCQPYISKDIKKANLISH
jgi:hypothetical protein